MPNGTSEIISLLRKHRVRLDRGLRDYEIDAVERRFAFRFPPDLRDLLGAVLPLGDGFPHWRRADRDSREADDVAQQLAWPLKGALFDVEHNRFWPRSWRPRPETLDDRRREITRRISAAPKLVPIFKHRYICSEPHESGNPVLSIYQTDIIYYGRNLGDYFVHEFDKPEVSIGPRDVRIVPFWSDYVRECWNQDNTVSGL